MVDRPARRPSCAPPDIDVTELLVAVAAGDVDAFVRLPVAVAPMVGRITKGTVRNHAMAAEVAQEVMVEVWAKAPLRDEFSLPAMAYISTVARRRAVDRVRSEQAESNWRVRNAQRSAQARHGDPTADAATEHLEWQQIERALATLTPRQRESIELAFYRGLTYSQVARVLDIPLGTVKTRIREALIRIRRHLDDGSGASG